jgi:hypothetical protein
MQPPAVVRMGGDLAVAMVVQQRDLVAHVDQRDPAETGDQRVPHEKAVDGAVDLCRIALREGTLQPRQRRACAAVALVAGLRVVLEQLPRREGAGKAPS